MSVRTFFLPNGNRIDINDGRSDSSANGVIDQFDRIRINRHDYTLSTIEALEADHPDRRAWEFLRRELSVSSLTGVNLSHASRIFGLREQARYLLTQPNPTADQRRIIQGFIDGSNEWARSFGFGTITQAGLRALSLPEPVFPRWAALDCLWNSGWVFCAAGAPTSEETQIRDAQRHNRRVRIEISE